MNNKPPSATIFAGLGGVNIAYEAFKKNKEGHPIQKLTDLHLISVSFYHGRKPGEDHKGRRLLHSVS